uniref:transcription factor GTE9-like n=1 Tax=Erigeron canadensis TaxID=72917 RepID=UPI001CB9A4BE|nr:transcription factor GTE9-like [Erigeron canadensis]
MAKKDRFPDGYSAGGLPRNEESGCSGRDHNETTSGYENPSGFRKKWITLSSAMQDGFSVPIRNVSLSTLADSEKDLWLLRLRSELDQVRTFQKCVDVDSKTNVAVVSSSSNVVDDVRGNVQGNQTKVRKSIEPKTQKGSGGNRGVGSRFLSVNEPVSSAVVPDTFSLILKKQCETLLKKLMTHQHGWVFNTPVDVVTLKIPDYYTVITKPMDFGTIKEKLGSGGYDSPYEFASDIRLTFSNAKTYNPPGNDVHIMADVLSKFFELRWKPIEKKLVANNSSQQKPVQEEIDLAPTKKRKISPVQPNILPEPVKPVMTNDEKVRLSTDLETHLSDLSANIIDFLRRHSSNKNEAGEDEIEIEIDNLSSETLFELRKMLDDHIREKQNSAKAEPCVIELLNEPGLSNSTMQLYKGNDLMDEDVDAAGNEPPVASCPPADFDKGTNEINNKQATSDSEPIRASENELKEVKASSSVGGAKETADAEVDLGQKTDTTCSAENKSKPSSASENELRGVKASSPSSGATEINVLQVDLGQKTGTSYSAENGLVGASDNAEPISQQKSNSNESDNHKDDGDSAPDERQVSPDKRYRAAVLIGRFADTILKAREKTLHQDERADPDKLRREKEQLENQRRKEKARLQAEAKAAEEARRRVEAEAAAEAKRKRDLEREAARQALLKVEETVEIDETSRFLKDLDMLRTADNDQPLPSYLDEISPELESQDGLGSFKFGASNPLEQLGLYMKRDEHEEEEEIELEPVSTVGDEPGVINNDVEEGEIN